MDACRSHARPWDVVALSRLDFYGKDSAWGGPGSGGR